MLQQYLHLDKYPDFIDSARNPGTLTGTCVLWFGMLNTHDAQDQTVRSTWATNIWDFEQFSFHGLTEQKYFWHIKSCAVRDDLLHICRYHVLSHMYD